MNNGGKHAISGLVIIVNHYVITKVGWNISMPHKLYIIVIYKVITTKGNKWVSFQELYIIVIYKVITIKDLDKIWELVVYNINL